MSGVGHYGEDMRDMMSAADMIGLRSAGGADFDRMFLTMLKPGLDPAHPLLVDPLGEVGSAAAPVVLQADSSSDR